MGPDDVGAPAVLGETVGQPAGKGKGRVAPQVIFMACGNVFLVVEGLDRVVFRAIGQSQQKPGQGQGHVAGVVRLPEGLPFGILGPFEDGLQVLQLGQFVEVVDPEKLRTGSGDKRGVGHGGHAGDILQQLDVLGPGPNS